MSEMVERAAKAIFDARFNHPEDFWPHRIDEIVTGPPFDADGYREMARAATEAMREPTVEMVKASDRRNDDNDHEEAIVANWQAMIDAALNSSDQ